MVDKGSGSIEVGVQLSYIESGSVIKRRVRLFPLLSYMSTKSSTSLRGTERP